LDRYVIIGSTPSTHLIVPRHRLDTDSHDLQTEGINGE